MGDFFVTLVFGIALGAGIFMYNADSNITQTRIDQFNESCLNNGGTKLITDNVYSPNFTVECHDGAVFTYINSDEFEKKRK